MSAQEDENTIQPWRQANQFTLTMRGHWAGIPEESDTVLLSDYDPYAVDDVSPQIREIASDGNYNTYFDSFYAPLDFQLSGLAFKIPTYLPEGVGYKIRVKVNGSQLELMQIPADEDHNQKTYAIECSSVIYEDDYIEVEVTFTGNGDLLSFNANNMVFSISGCAWYGMYKGIYADETATVATTEDITLSGPQLIDSFSTSSGDVVLVKNQSTSSENGLWIVQGGAWTRHASYPDVGSLDGIIIHVLYGNTQNSTDNTNYVFSSGGISTAEIPLIEWEQGDKWFKGGIHLQNRSGNETLSDRVIIDIAKVTHNFLIQGVSLSVFDDPLMVVNKLKSKDYCLFVDLLVNGQSFLASLGFPRPIPIDPDVSKFKTYDIGAFNDLEGFPVRFGDVISMRLYQGNPYTRINGKIIQAYVYGCGPDCAALDSPLVAVYEPCEDEPCEWKYQVTDRCDPEAAKAAKKNPEVIASSPSLPSTKEYVTVDGIYVTVNGERVWI